MHLIGIYFFIWPEFQNSSFLNPQIANPKNNFFSFYENENLIGFINLYEEDTEIFFGIGVNPEFCNNGYGQQMTLL